MPRMWLALTLLLQQPAEWDAGELPGETRRTIGVALHHTVKSHFTSCRCLTIEMVDASRANLHLDTLKMRGPVSASANFLLEDGRLLAVPVRFEVTTTVPGEPKLLLFYTGWSWDAHRAVEWVGREGQAKNIPHEMRNLERAANGERMRAMGHAGDLVLIDHGRAYVGADAVRARVEGLAGTVDPPSWDLGEVVSGRTFAREVRVSGGKLRAAIPSCPCFRARILSDSVVRVDVDTTGLVGSHDKPIEFVLEGEKRARLHIRFDAIGERPAERPEIELFYSGRNVPNWPVLTQDVAAIARARGATYAIRMIERCGAKVKADVWFRDGDAVFVGPQDVNRAVAERRPPGIPGPPPPAPAPGAVKVRLFYFASCPSCGPLLARLRARRGIDLELLELDRLENVRLLLSLQEGMGVKETRVPVALAGARFLAGLEAVEAGLEEAIAAIERGEAENRDLLATAPAAEGRARALPIAAVIVAGLVDGVNPCAFVTAVFLVAFLAFAKRGPAEILAAGLVYVAAVYATYYAIGLGGLAALRSIPASGWLYGATAAFVLVLAAVSVRDAVVYARTRDGARVWLQLPLGLKKRIHATVRSRLGTFAGAATAGFLVTLFEAVCTGQIYLPTLVLMAREGGGHGVLALYNAAFVLPLVAVLGLSVAGMRSQRLAAFSERNVVVAKLLAAGLYAGLGVYLLTAISR